MSQNIFDDFFGEDGPLQQSFGPGPGAAGYGPPFPAKPAQEEKGVAWAAKDIDGDLFVPLKQVGELLVANNVLPKMQERINANVRAAEDKKTLDI